MIKKSSNITDKVKIEIIRRLLEENPGCLCGNFERCEICNSHSYFNRLRDKIFEITDGPKPILRLSDYGKSITIQL